MHKKLKKKYTLLVADDEAVIAMSLQQTLRDHGYHVPETAKSMEEILSKVERLRPDLVLMDIKLSGSGDGIEAAQLIRDQFGIPVVYISAYSDVATVERAKFTEPYGYILKPISERELQIVVEIALHRKHQDELVKRQALQQATLAEFGQFALENPSAEELYAKCSAAATKGLGLDMCMVFESLDHDKKPDSGLCVRIEGHSAPPSLIIAQTKGFRRFLPHEEAFIKSLGIMLAGALHRKAIEAELHKAVQNAEKSQRLAEKANQAKSAFLANMSHEIRTPLGVVLGFSELLAYGNEETSEEERLNFVSIIKRNGELLTTVINDILDLSKIEAGKLEFEHIDIHLAQLLQGISEPLNTLAKSKGLSFSLTVEPSAPNVIKSDPTRLSQILLNIIGNALKFTSKGSVDVTVRMQQGPNSKNSLEILVKDSGCGIEPESIKKLFTSFSQADDSTTRKFGGTGLGLALSKRFAKALGGNVSLVESTPNVGSTFKISIDPGDASMGTKF